MLSILLGRSFEVQVDPTILEEGCHFAEIVAWDSEQISSGPLFFVPVTIVKASSVELKTKYENLDFKPATVWRKFIQTSPDACFASKWLEISYIIKNLF